MEVIIGVCILLPLLGILFQDLRFREVHVAFFFLLFFLLTLRIILLDGWWFWLECFGLNVLLVGFNLAFASVYFSIKRRQIRFLTQGLLGWGDVVFFVCMAGGFEFSAFCVVFPVSLLAALLTWLPVMLVKREQMNRIPLAGLQSLFLIFVEVVKLFCGKDVFELFLIPVFQ